MGAGSWSLAVRMVRGVFVGAGCRVQGIFMAVSGYATNEMVSAMLMP